MPSPISTYLINHLFITVWSHRYLLDSLGYTPVSSLLPFFAQIVSVLALRSSQVPSIVPPNLFLGTFFMAQKMLQAQHMKHVCMIFNYVSYLKIKISPSTSVDH